MTGGTGLRRILMLVLGTTVVTVFGLAVRGQPLQNPFDNPFDTPPLRTPQPGPRTPAAGPAQPDTGVPELRGTRTPAPTTPSRPFTPSPQPRPPVQRTTPEAARGTTQPPGDTSQPRDRGSMDDNPFGDDAVQPTEPEPSDASSARPRRDSLDLPSPSESTELPAPSANVDTDLLRRINELLTADKFEEAIPLLESVTKQAPEEFQIWNALGVSYRMMGRYDDAIKAFGNALKHAPTIGDESMTYVRRGIVWFSKGEPRIAIADFDQAASGTTNDPRPEFWKGLVLARQGRYREAVTAYSNSLRLYGGYTNARNNRGLAYLAMGEINFAITDFDEVIRQTPDNSSAYYKRGIALGRRGDLREAVDSYTQAIRLDPRFAPSYYNRGLLYRRLGNTQQADADLKKANELDPKVESLARPLELARR
jgi:tetratricopeptide (TPR) repeat protein